MTTTRLKAVFWGATVLVVILWLLSLEPGTLTGGFWSVRGALVYGLGILAISYLSLAVILAARPVQFENLLGGLDKFYQLHRWFGVAGAVAAIAHWFAEVGVRWMARQGWLPRASARPRHPGRPKASTRSATSASPRPPSARSPSTCSWPWSWSRSGSGSPIATSSRSTSSSRPSSSCWSFTR